MAHSKKLIILTVAAMAGLSACKSTTSGPCDEPTPAGRLAAADLMLECLNTLDNTPVASMPTTGSATYNGFVSGTVEVASGVSDVLFGDATMIANFGASSVSGTLSNFDSGAVGAMTGTLDIAGGTISGNSYSGATVSGAAPLVYGTDTLDISGTSDGIFLGTKAQGIVGAVDGTSTLGSTGYSGTTALFIFGQK